MPEINFAKMHAQGNDFVVLDGSAGELANGITAAQAKFLGDRQTGIGADQILMLLPNSNDEFVYRIWNNDGSEVGQCGNGARAGFHFLQRLGKVAPDTKEVTLRTSTATIKVGPGTGESIRAYLAKPEFTPAKIPMQADMEQDDQYLIKDSGKYFSALSLGNPHAVFLCEQLPTDFAAEVAAVSEYFPDGVNVGFAVRPGQQEQPYRLRVVERGAGLTKACGSAAAALAVVEHNNLQVNSIAIAVDGGSLTAGYAGEDSLAWVEGKVTYVFSGSIFLEFNGA